jgi:hypothetical protein
LERASPSLSDDWSYGDRILISLGGCSSEKKILRHEQKADAFFAAGEYEKAEIEYLNVFKLDPKTSTRCGRWG